MRFVVGPRGCVDEAQLWWRPCSFLFGGLWDMSSGKGEALSQKHLHVCFVRGPAGFWRLSQKQGSQSKRKSTPPSNLRKMRRLVSFLQRSAVGRPSEWFVYQPIVLSP